MSNKELLKEYTCVLVKEKAIYFSTERGVKPIYLFLKSGKDFSGFCAYDRVVGKATAFLYMLLGVKEIKALVISEPALMLLEENNIAVKFDKKVKNIINRKGDDLCPFEKAVLEVNDKADAFKIIEEKMLELNIIKKA